MSNWVHINCMFTLKSAGSDTYFNNEKENRTELRKRQLKKLYKALSKIERIEHCSQGWDRDLRFYIKPEFITKRRDYKNGFSVDYDDLIVCNIIGDIRWDSNSDHHFEELIKDIWYNSDIYIRDGICKISESYEQDVILVYNSIYNRMDIHRDDLWELEINSDVFDSFDLNKDSNTITINDNYVYKIDDLFKEPKKYEKEFKDNFDVYIKIHN